METGRAGRDNEVCLCRITQRAMSAITSAETHTYTHAGTSPEQSHENDSAGRKKTQEHLDCLAVCCCPSISLLMVMLCAKAPVVWRDTGVCVCASVKVKERERVRSTQQEQETAAMRRCQLRRLSAFGSEVLRWRWRCVISPPLSLLLLLLLLLTVTPFRASHTSLLSFPSLSCSSITLYIYMRTMCARLCVYIR